MIGIQELFHGSEMHRADKIVEELKFTISKDDKHWLGDGIYFYFDRTLAYRWIWNMHKAAFRGAISNDSLYENYRILICSVNFVRGRVYNLKVVEHQEDFKKVKRMVLDKASKSEMISNARIVDGTILNLMFHEFGYNKDFDIVIALFTNKKPNIRELGNKSRIVYETEEQVCIKNEDCIQSIHLMERQYFDEIYQIMETFYNKSIYHQKHKKVY